MDLIDILMERKDVAAAVDARFVAGREHLERAAELASTAEERGTRVADDPSVEVLLYAAATRQISRAIDTVGVREDTEEVGLVVQGMDVAALLEEAGLERDGSVLEFKEEKLPFIRQAFDISETEMETVGEAKVPLLVRERVALSDLDR